uniref:Acyltransferase n=1 Tax=Pithovirus LCPAC202 TaxID=2506592 RepID=A0A481Z5N0_9VIRU|nr:MAG: acyltransferase [Pithovirus LCPAC202]
MGNLGARFLLESIGWSFPPEDDLERFTKPEAKRMIIVISHTSYWDFFLLLLTKLSDDRMKENLYIVMKPQPFDLFGWFLRPLGCIPATRKEDRGEGFVDKTIKRFDNQDMRLIISPEGEMGASKWKSGYYHLLKGMKTSIMVAGADYERKTMYLGPIHSWKEIQKWSKDKLEKTLQTEMGNVVPLYPNQSHTPILRSYCPEKISAVHPFLLILTIIVVVLIIIIIVLLFRSPKSKK